MMRFEHGGDIYSYRDKYGKEPLDFSTNMNPLGLSELTKEAYYGAINNLSNYPDFRCTYLIKAISKYNDIDEKAIVCGNGAADIIFRIVYGARPERALLIAPTFSEYEKALLAINSSIKFHNLKEEDGFALKDDFLEKIADIDILFLCNPNNPIGNLVDKILLLKILKKCHEIGAILVMDECFEEFIGDSSMKGHLLEYKNLVIIKALTKSFAMAGLRLGYCLTYNGELIKAIQNAGQSWSVSTVAQQCGVAALSDIAYLENSKKLITEERIYLIDELNKLGCKVFDAKANYIFFKSVEQLDKSLEAHGILIRNCSNYRNLSEGFYRIAIKNRHDNNLLVSALKKVING